LRHQKWKQRIGKVPDANSKETMKTKGIFRMAASIVAGLILVPMARATPVQWNGNGHYYDFIQDNVSWFFATGFSSTITFQGVEGHLATITSAAENSFLTTTFQQSGAPRFAWFGGMMFPGGVWRWRTGPPPEFDTQFSNGATPTPPYNYANWGGTEPNGPPPFEFTALNLGTAALGVASGQWADFSSTFDTGDPAVVGYLVEFEIPEPSSLALLGLATLGVFYRRRRIRVAR
jgi:PEP-CTERM motif